VWHIIGLIVGIILCLVGGYYLWVFFRFGPVDRATAELEAEIWKKAMEEKKGQYDDEWALYNIYRSDAEADARGEGFFPSFFRNVGLVLLALGLSIIALVLIL